MSFSHFLLDCQFVDCVPKTRRQESKKKMKMIMRRKVEEREERRDVLSRLSEKWFLLPSSIYDGNRWNKD